MYSLIMISLLLSESKVNSGTTGIASHHGCGDRTTGACENPAPPTEFAATGADSCHWGHRYRITYGGSAEGSSCGCTDAPTVTVQNTDEQLINLSMHLCYTCKY